MTRCCITLSGVYPKVVPIVNQYKRTGDLMPAMTKFARIAPAGLELYRGTVFGREFEGNLLFQSEGAEVLFRNTELRPLHK